MTQLQTPLARARGLGAAGEGVGHFWAQRLTALALIPLTLWFCFSIAMLPQANYAAVVGWMQSPFNAVLSMLTLLVSLYHGQLGVQVILEDYVSSSPIRLAAIVITQFLSVLLAALGLFSILKISLATTL